MPFNAENKHSILLFSVVNPGRGNFEKVFFEVSRFGDFDSGVSLESDVLCHSKFTAYSLFVIASFATEVEHYST